MSSSIYGSTLLFGGTYKHPQGHLVECVGARKVGDTIVVMTKDGRLTDDTPLKRFKADFTATMDQPADTFEVTIEA